MMTKEEILNKHGWIDGFSIHSNPLKQIKSLHDAMDEYAHQFLSEFLYKD